MKEGEEMGKFVQIGTAAVRSPEGEFLPAEPIYRELPSETDQSAEYIPGDVLFDLFADKCQNYIKEAKKCREKSSLNIKRT